MYMHNGQGIQTLLRTLRPEVRLQSSKRTKASLSFTRCAGESHIESKNRCEGWEKNLEICLTFKCFNQFVSSRDANVLRPFVV